MADKQGKDLALILSDDAFTTSYTLVCFVSGSTKSSFSVNTEESACGVHTGIGSVNFSVNATAIVKVDPTAATGTPLVGEASYKKLKQWNVGQTLVAYKVTAGTAGADFYETGDMYLNDISLDWQVGQTVKTSFTMTGTGTLDITP